MSGLVGGLKQFDVSKFDTVADEDMPAAGIAVPPSSDSDLAGANAPIKSDESVGGEPTCLYGLDKPSASVVLAFTT